MNRKNALKFRKQEAGFTLLELLIVMVIIGLLVALVSPKFTGKVEEANVKTTKAQIELLSSALESYYMDMREYPTTEQGLEALLKRPTGVSRTRWRGPYLKKLNLPKDAWDHDFIYLGRDDQEVKNKGLDFIIMSYGRDGKPGGTGQDSDIFSYE